MATGVGQGAASLGTKMPQAIRPEPYSVFPVAADAGTLDPTFGTGSDVWGLSPLGDPPGSLAHRGERAAPR
jgi:hypothetical protein